MPNRSLDLARCRSEGRPCPVCGQAMRPCQTCGYLDCYGCFIVAIPNRLEHALSNPGGHRMISDLHGEIWDLQDLRDQIND